MEQCGYYYSIGPYGTIFPQFFYYPPVQIDRLSTYHSIQSKKQEFPVKQQLTKSNNIILNNEEIDQINTKNENTIKKQNQTVAIKKNKYKIKKNTRNIIPNLARKIVNFLNSKQCKNIVLKLYPLLNVYQKSKFNEYTNLLKKKLTSYFGNKKLLQIWYKSTKSSRLKQFLKIIRIVSKHFLDNCCISSILLSKKMSPDLKLQHLKYRRKMQSILQNGFKDDFNIQDL